MRRQGSQCPEQFPLFLDPNRSRIFLKAPKIITFPLKLFTMNASNLKNIKIGLICVFAILAVILVNQISGYIGFYNEVQISISEQDKSVRSKMESLIEFQKLHIEQNNAFAQLAYATSSEELESWINYNTAMAAAITDALILDKAKLEMLVEFSFLHRISIITSQIDGLYDEANEESLEDTLNALTKQWVLSNLSNKYVADLYTNKPKTTVAIIFGSQDSIQIAKLEQALSSPTDSSRDSAVELEDLVLTQLNNEGIGRIVSAVRPTSGHVEFIFSSGNRLIDRLKAVYNKENTVRLDDVSLSLTQEWIMANFEVYQEELAEIANTYLANILNQEAILVSNGPLSPRKSRLFEIQTEIARTLADLLSMDYIIRDLAQTDLAYYNSWIARYPEANTLESIQNTLTDSNFNELAFLKDVMEFEQDALDTADLTSLEQLGTPDSIARAIHTRFSLGSQVASKLNGGNSNTLSVWLYTQDSKADGFTKIYRNELEQNRSNFNTWRSIANNIFTSNKKISDKVKTVGIADIASMFNDDIGPLSFTFSVNSSGYYITEAFQKVSHEGSFIKIYEDLYTYYLKGVRGSIDLSTNDENKANASVYEKYAGNLFSNSSGRFMDFKDVLASNLHLVNLDENSFQSRLEAVEASFGETFNDAYNQHKIEAFKRFNTVIADSTADSTAWQIFSIEWDMNFEKILSLANRVTSDGIGDDASFGEFSVLVDENYTKVQRDIHNQLVMDAFSDAVIEKSNFNLRLGKFNVLAIEISRDDYLGFLDGINPPGYVVFKGPLQNAKQTLINQSPAALTVQGELKPADSGIEVGDERKNWASDKKGDE
ncbi:MAG: hypothetical protein CMN34_00155 [Saprospirales bacterium]|nr:hypothetical protein [Saprospirales bacterium]